MSDPLIQQRCQFLLLSDVFGCNFHHILFSQDLEWESLWIAVSALRVSSTYIFKLFSVDCDSVLSDVQVKCTYVLSL